MSKNIDDINNIYDIYKYYLEWDLVKFKKEFDGFFGYICMKHYGIRDQNSDDFYDLKNDVFVDVIDYLKKGFYDKGKGAFVTYLYMVIKWKLKVKYNYYKRYMNVIGKLKNKYVKKSSIYNVVVNILSRYDLLDKVDVIYYVDLFSNVNKLCKDYIGRFILWEIYINNLDS